MKDFSQATRAYILGVIFVAGLLALWQFNQTVVENIWIVLAASAAASVLQSVAVFGSTARSTYSLSWIIYSFVLVLEGPGAALIVILASHLVEWMSARERLAWYIQAFNVGNFFIVVWLSGRIIHAGEQYAYPDPILSFFIVTAALAAFTFVNHLLVALVIRLARGQTFAESGVFGWFTLFLDFSLLCLGYAAAIIWQVNPVALVLVLFVSLMLFEALKIPALERKAEIDPKTQLYNAQYFTNALEEEINRSRRFNRPLSLVMADLDLLRNINNTYGHLAGDVVLNGIATILQEMVREIDIASRFGGEEFSILLPETTSEEAFLLTERIRKCVEETAFEVSTSVEPIKATMSFGIASWQGEGQTAEMLIHNADVALYRAKESGRNRCCSFDAELDEVGMEQQREWDKLNIVAKAVPSTVPQEDKSGPGSAKAHNLDKSPHAGATEARYGASVADTAAAAQKKPKPAASRARRLYPAWATELYIAILLLTTVIGASFLLQPVENIDWAPLLFFAGIVLVMEAASIEIYVQDTTVSTTAAFLVAGVMLFGAPAALILGAVIALVSVAKRRMKLSRFLFNSSNHILGGLAVAALLTIAGAPLETWPLGQVLVVGAGSAGLLYITTTLLITIVIGLDSGLSFQSIWQQRFRWLLPYYLALGLVAAALAFSYLTINITGIFIIILPLLMLRYSQKQYIDHTESLVRSLQNTNEKLTEQADEITRLNEEMLLTLARSLDLRDPHVLEHSKHVSRYAECVAREMGLPQAQVENIRKAGLLHDIGKLGVPEEILFKPSNLTADEYRQVKKHVTIGAKLIQGCHSFESLVPFILHHHEWYNGEGYPSKLHGDEIPLEARILSLADAVEAMASDRPYKKALPPAEILKEVERCAGTQFDPVIVKAFGRIVLREGEKIIVNSARNVNIRNEKEAMTYPPHY